MPMLYSRWDRRDNANRTDFGLASLNMCRQQRGRDGVTSARYYWSDASTIVVLVESERRLLPLEPGNADLAKGGFAMNDLARRVDSDTWAEARLGFDAFQSAGSPAGT